MIDDVTSLHARPVRPGEVVVVGSGAAGLALAGRLATAGRGVVVLESGPDTDAGAADRAAGADLNVGETTGLPFRLVEGRSRVLGGTTELWHGQCMRLHPVDLAPRAWVEGSGWPFDGAALASWYDEAESWFGVQGGSYGAERWAPYPGLPPLAWDPEFLLHDFTEYTPQPMVGRVRRAELAAHPSVRVVVNATATRVIVAGGTTGAVTGVEVAGPDGRRHTVAATDVVLAAGAIENARLLQLSDPEGIGLGAGREHTGRFLQDHPIIRLAEVLPRDPHVLQDRYIVLHRGKQRLFPKVRLAPGAQEAHGLLDATVAFVHEHDDPALDAARRLVLAARSGRRPEHPGRDLLAAARAPRPVVRDTWRRYARGLASGTPASHVWLQVWVEQGPEADRRVTLGTGVDALGLRRASVHWTATDQELLTSRTLARWVARDLERLGVATVRDLPAMTDDDAWRATVTDAYHPAGTTRLAADPADGVVDLDLQVHGVDGLAVVGGSVFPTSGYANPTLTIVAMALRLGARLGAAGGRRAA